LDYQILFVYLFGFDNNIFFLTLKKDSLLILSITFSIPFVIGITLQLIGGTFFGIGVIGGSDLQKIQRGAKRYHRKRMSSINYDFYSMFDAEGFDYEILLFHFILSLILVGLLIGVTAIVSYSFNENFSLIFDILRAVCFTWFLSTFYLAFRQTPFNFKNDLSFIMHPLFGFVPIVLAIPLILRFMFNTTILIQVLQSIILMVVIYLVYFFTVIVFNAVQKLPKIALVLFGFAMYFGGTWLM
jgi:hypothetical protein